MRHIDLDTGPAVSDGRMLIALSGHLDTGLSGITLLEELNQQWGMTRLGVIDIDPFFLYGPRCPWSHRHDDGTIQVHWPRMEIHQRRSPRSPLVVTGWRPNLRLREFGRVLADLARTCDVRQVVQVGSVDMRVPHTLPVPVAGTATSSELHGLQGDIGLSPGPGGEDPAILDACMQHGLEYASLSAHLPEYVQMKPNWTGVAALARRVGAMLDLDIRTERFDAESEKLLGQLAAATDSNPVLANAVADLERAMGLEQQRQAEAREIREIDPEAVAGEVEDFLRREREGN